MDKLSVHQASSKLAKAKRKPIKVVYISNPMHVKASAAQFRELVQKLTGRDSDIAEFSEFTMLETANDPAKNPKPASTASWCDTGVGPADLGAKNGVGQHRETYKNEGSLAKVLDDAFVPAMLENFDGFIPASMFYEPPHVGPFRSIDQV